MILPVYDSGDFAPWAFAGARVVAEVAFRGPWRALGLAMRYAGADGENRYG